MPDQPMQDLFEGTEGLAEIGRGLYQPPMGSTMALGRPEFVRVVFDDLPRVSTRLRAAEIDELATALLAASGKLTERGGNRFAAELEEALRRARREQLDLVYPYRLLEWFELAGVRLEPVDVARVFAGQELLAGLPDREIGSLERSSDRVTDAAARCLELHALALAGIQTPRGGPGGEGWTSGRWRLGWRLGEGEGGVVEVAARIERPEALVTLRGSYAVTLASHGAGLQPQLEESELVAEVARTSSLERGVFWLTGEALEDAIVTLHPQVMAEAIYGRTEG